MTVTDAAHLANVHISEISRSLMTFMPMRPMVCCCAVPQFVIYPTRKGGNALGVTFQWPSQRERRAAQADAFLIYALEHECENGFSDALRRLGWIHANVTVSVSRFAAFWLFSVRPSNAALHLVCVAIGPFCQSTMPRHW
jgi:secreted Zn-dependent insulinase-like peptidase